MQTVVQIVSAILTMMGQAHLAAQVQADAAAGKFTVEEGLELGEAIAQALESYLPKDAPELALVSSVAAAVDTYLKAKAATAPPQPPTVTVPAPAKTTGPGGPGGTIRS